MASTPHVIDVDDSNFQQEVIERSAEVPVVVDFWAPWCGPCRALGPTLEALAEEGGGAWVLAKLNTDDNQQTASQYKIRGIPAVKAFVDGRVVDDFTGALPRQSVESWLQGFMPSEADELVGEGKTAEKRGNLVEAAAAYEQALAHDEFNPKALVGMARVRTAEGDLDGALDYLDRINEAQAEELGGAYEKLWVRIQAERAAPKDELEERVADDPNDLEAHFELAMHLGADEQFDAACDQLLEIVMRDRDWRDDLGRRAILRLFQIMGPQTDEVRQWRGKLGRAMY